MAELSVAETLKEFAQKITVSKVTERRRILGNVATCVAKPDLPEPAIKGIFKHLISTLGLYRDAKSRHAVDGVVLALATHHKEKALKGANAILADFAEAQKRVVPCVLDSGSALNALGWTCLLLRHGFAGQDLMEGPDFQKMVSIQAWLLYGCLAVQRANITQAAFKRMKRIWNEIPGSLDQYVSVITPMEPGFQLLSLISLIMKQLTLLKDHTKIQELRAPFINIYVKAVIASRSKPPKHLLESCKDLLKHATHEDFQETILPAMEKAMLRNPEIMLEGVVYLLAGLSIDLSQYSITVGKLLATQLHAKEDEAREVGAQGCRYLAHQCSDPAAVEKLGCHIFDVLNGSEGKLTMIVQRQGLLTGLGHLSQNAVTGTASVQQLAATIAEGFIPFLQQEVHEGTLVHALTMFSRWCAKFQIEVPVKIIEWFKTGMGLKSSTSGVRNAYILCMNAAFHGDRLHAGLTMMPLLLQTLDKAASQASNGPLVCEGVSAACLLTKLVQADCLIEPKLAPMWAIICDSDKQLFTNEKFLQSCSEDCLMHLATLVERLVLDHPQKIEGKVANNYYRAFIFVLTRGTYRQRKHAHSCTRKMLSALGGATVTLALIKEFELMLASQRVSDARNDVCENGESSSDYQKYLSPRILTEAILSLGRVPTPESQEAEKVVMETLGVAHHSLIVIYNCDTWVDIAAGLKVDVASFVASHIDNIADTLCSATEIDQTLQNMMGTLARVAPSMILPRLVTHIDKKLSNPSLLTVTREDYCIMLTPEGELYDKSILESSSRKDDNKTANMKRENKLYSYAEQLAEIELKKEIDRKKGRNAKKEEPKLSKKQQEAIATQLAAESETRTRLKHMDAELQQATLTLLACCRGNAEGLRRHLPVIVKRVISLLKSPLASPYMVNVFVKLRAAALSQLSKVSGYLVAYSSLRLMEPACELDKGWSQEPLKSQATRALTMLQELTTEPPNGSDKPLLAPSFAYSFYLLRGILLGEMSFWGQELFLGALDIMSAHAKLRAQKDDDVESDEAGPKLLPRKQMLSLLTRIVGTNAGMIQQRAAHVILDVATCASGLQGCATAKQEEIDELLDALTAPAMVVREAALQGLIALCLVLPPSDVFPHGMRLLQRVWVAKFDPEESNVKLADRLWDEAGLEVNDYLCTALVDDIIHPEGVVRESAAKALSATLQQHPDFVSAILQQLLELYEEKLYVPPPVVDDFGRVISESPPDEWPARCGIAMAIHRMAIYFTQDLIGILFEFFVQKGLRDRSDEVRKAMLTAAVAAVNEHGKANVKSLLDVFEQFLADAPDTASYDTVRQSVVILMGSLAKHLDKDDPKVKPIVAKLIETLSTPSQQVQEAVANCLPPLVPAIKADAPELVQKLMQLLLEAENYGERKGAAYGLAGLIKGLGILALKQLDIMGTLTAAIQNKKNPRYREGALFAFEMLCIMLGRLFEPYVVHILPHLLLCFGDANQYVREAADDTAKAVMSKLSAHGVKLVLPALLSALEEDSWRTKTGSVELLGAMAFCAPKQLSACLPSIVPKLMEVLTDSHLKVQNSGAQALKQIGSVIKNPEIQAIVPVLLEALQDPTRKTTPCLHSLLQTKFVHFIDAPSLALIMPVVQRAFQDRSTETRKMAAQIIGNMYSLTDQKDLSPYLPNVIPGLKQSLLDPVPEVRSVSARALGAMIRGMGESGFEDLLPWLMRTLTSEQSSVDRSGAAQGLSEVIGGLGIDKLERFMPEIIQTAERSDIQSHVRDGYIMMYIYLPGVFGDEFMKYVGPIIPSILKALADENEYVRDTALRAGQRIVSTYADKAIQLLLPELEQGLFDDNWRIRFSSVQLLGDLLYKISGVSGKMSTETADEDDNFGTETSQQAIFRALGENRRNRVLAGLYMGRSDTSPMVRQASLHVWKVIVSHTPKTLRQILSTLFSLLLGCLASSCYDKRQVAARTLGDVVRKLGEKVLPEIIPILEQGLESDRSDQRQGVCIGLSEIMASTSRDHVIVFADSLIPTVRKALCDPLPEVREAAAKTFDNLHSNIGNRALDDTLPNLLAKLDDAEQSEFALDGLQQVMAVKSRVVLPYLVPQLTSPPVNTRALSFLSSVAGEALTKHLSRILPALMSSLKDKMGTEEEQQELEYCQGVVLSVHDDIGIRTVMDELMTATHKDNAGLRWAAVTILQVYCERTKNDFSEYVPQLFRGLLSLFTDTDERVLNAAWDCLNAVIKQLDASEMLGHISNMRQALRFALMDYKEEELPGFCLQKKGITPIWLVYREGILNGPQELKEQAAVGLGEVIRRTSAAALKPSVVSLTGPLIRILGDRFNYSVKVAVLETLGLLLGKCGTMLKPFLPQLQTTFVKALNDPHRAVRLKAATALGKLIIIHTRVDPLFTELHTGVKNAEDIGIRDTMLQALRGCIAGAGPKMSDIIRRQVTASLEGHLSTTEDSTRTTAAACLGTMCTCLKEEELNTVLTKQLLDTDTSEDWILRHGRAVALFVALKEAPERLLMGSHRKRILSATRAVVASDRIPLSVAGLRCLGFILHHQVTQQEPLTTELLSDLAKCMKQDSNDVKQLAAMVVSYVAKSSQEPLDLSVMKTLVPMLVNGTKEKNTLVRTNSECALVALLKMRKDDSILQTCLNALEQGMREVLSETAGKVLRKTISQPDTMEDIDDTVLV